MEKIFEMGLRNKFRFEYKGLITMEDLWDLKIEQLDSIYKNLSTKLNKANEESLLNSKTKEQQVIEMKREIVKYIFDVKMKEIEDKKSLIAKKEQKQKLMQLIDEKENEALKGKSVDELKKMLDDLE